MSEFEILDRCFGIWNKDRLEASKDSNILIGDDCSVTRNAQGQIELMTHEMFVEEIHFTKESIGIEDLAYKILLASCSDIAAMGGVVKSILLGVACPMENNLNYLESFLQAFSIEVERLGALFCGGDLSRSKSHICFSVSVIGLANNDRALKRSGAKANDLICVNSFLGDSCGGLKLLQSSRSQFSEIEQYLLRRHRRPPNYLKEGAWLNKQLSVHSMMDLSDGLSSDLRHICKQSDLGAKIYLEEIPVSRELATVAEERAWDKAQIALSGGEDYALLFSVDPQSFKLLQHSYQKEFSKSITVIGSMAKEHPGDIKYYKSGQEYTITMGFDHFTN